MKVSVAQLSRCELIAAFLMSSVEAVAQTPSSISAPAASSVPMASPVQSPASPPACLPVCRSGYTCIAGQCVSACNPACNTGELCTKDGQCQLKAVSDAKASVKIERTHANNPSMLVGGMLLSSVGAFAGLLGYLRINRDEFRCDNGQSAWCSTSKPGIALVATGGVMLAVGIPFIFLGARRVPNQPQASWVTQTDAQTMTLSLGTRGLVVSAAF